MEKTKIFMAIGVNFPRMWGLTEEKIIENVIVTIFSFNKIFSNRSFKNDHSFFL